MKYQDKTDHKYARRVVARAFRDSVDLLNRGEQVVVPEDGHAPGVILKDGRGDENRNVSVKLGQSAAAPKAAHAAEPIEETTQRVVVDEAVFNAMVAKTATPMMHNPFAALDIDLGKK